MARCVFAIVIATISASAFAAVTMSASMITKGVHFSLYL